MRILVVCTGNLCRSPLAERVLAQELPDVTVSSAGTDAPPGRPMDPQAAGELMRIGLSDRGHVSRLLTEAMVREADLVLTATRAHRQRVVALWPAALHRTFTIMELSLVEVPDALPGDLKQRIRELARRRPQGNANELDLADPIGQSDEVHHKVATDIVTASRRIAATVRRLQA